LTRSQRCVNNFGLVDPAQKEKLRVALDLETLRSQFASAQLASFAAQANLADVEQLGANELRDFAQAQLAVIARQTFFRKPDLDRATAQIEKEINALEARSNELNATESLRRADLKQANAELEAAKQTSAKAPELPVLQETVALRTDQLDTKRVRLELQRMAIEGYRLAQHVYQYRHVLANTENLPGVRESSLHVPGKFRNQPDLLEQEPAINDCGRSCLWVLKLSRQSQAPSPDRTRNKTLISNLKSCTFRIQ
jgi:hypothetical protein